MHWTLIAFDAHPDSVAMPIATPTHTAMPAPKAVQPGLTSTGLSRYRRSTESMADCIPGVGRPSARAHLRTGPLVRP